AVRNNQAPPPVRNRPLLLMRMPPVHHQRGAIKPFSEEPRIWLVLQPVRHVTVPVRDHAVGRDNRVTFNRCALHACSPLNALTQRFRQPSVSIRSDQAQLRASARANTTNPWPRGTPDTLSPARPHSGGTGETRIRCRQSH